MHMDHREIYENEIQLAPSEWDPTRVRSSFVFQVSCCSFVLGPHCCPDAVVSVCNHVQQQHT